MPEWYVMIAGLIRDLRKKAWDAKDALARSDAAAARLANEYLKQDYERVYQLWKGKTGVRVGFSPAGPAKLVFSSTEYDRR